jgi:hypothetical protein
MDSIPFDLITPWLVIIFVVSSPLHATFFWFFASALLETSSLAPKGMYFCAYWIVLSVLLLTRKTLSWKLVAPWLVTFFFSAFWINFFETTLVFVTQDAKQLDFEYFFRQFIEVFVTCALGMILARSWMSKFQGERVKGESLAT